MKINEVLRNKRIEKNIPQTKLAKMLKCHTQVVNNFERKGLGKMRPQLVIKYASKMGIPFQEFAGSVAVELFVEWSKRETNKKRKK